MRRACRPVSLLVFLSSAAAGCSVLASHVSIPEQTPARRSVIARAQVWAPTNVRAMDLRRGPQERGAFPFHALVPCNYVDKKLSGNSPKFPCRIGDRDEVKVKYGLKNGEVEGEVLASRLLWALGFGADRMYPVNVVCRGCPEELGGIKRPDDEFRFDPAVIERKMPGKEWSADGVEGWSWPELDSVDPARGGAPLVHRDALKLLAVFIQHTDTKVQQQRIVCLGASGKSDVCRRPFLMIQDLGVTFGRANFSNRNYPGSTNLTAWRSTAVWKSDTGCTGNLPKSFSGTLDDPVISEAGRRFLGGLLTQLSDRQLRDLFEVARVDLRLRKPGDAESGFATVDEWIDAFKAKRREIVERRCA